MRVSFEIVRTDAEQPWRARIVAGNGHTIFSSATYPRKAGAQRALAVLFGVCDCAFSLAPVIDVDEREPKAERPDARARRQMRNRRLKMIARCVDPDHPDYPNYGGRGITVHPAWVADLDTFIADVGLPPAPELSMDRIDNDGNYEPGNVRWATAKEQAQNKRVSLSSTCKRGHAYEAVDIDARGKRFCRTCRRDAGRRRRAAGRPS